LPGRRSFVSVTRQGMNPGRFAGVFRHRRLGFFGDMRKRRKL
jgi:hypothetical protein